MINVATFLTLVMSATELIIFNITPSFYNKEHPCIDHFSFLCTIHTLIQYIKTCLDASYRQFHSLLSSHHLLYIMSTDKQAAIRLQLQSVLQSLNMLPNAQLESNQTLTISYDVKLPMLEEPIFTMEITPSNTDLDYIAKSMDAATLSVPGSYIANVNAKLNVGWCHGTSIMPKEYIKWQTSTMTHYQNELYCCLYYVKKKRALWCWKILLQSREMQDGWRCVPDDLIRIFCHDSTDGVLSRDKDHIL